MKIVFTLDLMYQLGQHSETRRQLSAWVEDNEYATPVGVCWIVWYQPIGYVLLDIMVYDTYRRRGIATAMIEFARKTWPGLILTDAATEAGEALLGSLKETDLYGKK